MNTGKNTGNMTMEEQKQFSTLKEIDNKALIKEKYNNFNELYFGGQLGKCKFHLLRDGTSALGRFMSRTDKDGKEYGTIWISNNVYWTDELLDNTILHEMIHMYNCLVEKKGWISCGLFGHRGAFQRQCRRLKREYGVIVHDYSQDVPYKSKKHVPSRMEKILCPLFKW